MGNKTPAHVRPQAAIAEICLTYLNSPQIRALRHSTKEPWFRSSAKDTPFLEYCSVYWGVHAKNELSDYAKSLALELLQEYDDHVSGLWLMDKIGDLDSECYSTIPRFNGLHCASFFGIDEVVAALIETQCYGTNRGYFWGASPLTWAARNGHEEVVKILLGREEVDPDEPDDYGQTPLSYAAAKGNEEVVNILLQWEGVNCDKPDNRGRTPLSYAAQNGRLGVVKILLGQEKISPDRLDNDGQTPLSYAARGGQEEVMKMLLGQEEVNPDRPDNCGRTPLSYAAEGYFRG